MQETLDELSKKMDAMHKENTECKREIRLLEAKFALEKSISDELAQKVADRDMELEEVYSRGFWARVFNR